MAAYQPRGSKRTKIETNQLDLTDHNGYPAPVVWMALIYEGDDWIAEGYGTTAGEAVADAYRNRRDKKEAERER